MFRVPTAPIIRSTKTVTAASGTGIAQTSPDLATLEESSCTDIMTCTGGCVYNF